jgi:phage terminase large subunit-like protein
MAGQAERYIDMGAWDGCDAEPTSTGTAFGGLDLSATTDLTAFTMMVNGSDVYSIAFLPEHGIVERERRDRVPYRLWAEQGYLTLTPGKTIDYAYVKAAILEAAETFDLVDVNFDRWNSSQVVKQLEDEGIEMVQIGQGFASMSSPTKELQHLAVEGKLRHGGNPLLRWCVSNLAVKMDPSGNVKPDRDRSGGRIEPVVALVMALDGWQRRGQQQRRVSRYSDPDASLVVA